MYFELLHGRLEPGASDAEVARALAPRQGATMLGAWTAQTGADVPALVVLQGWPDFEARARAVADRADAASRLQQRGPTDGGALLLRHEVAVFGPSPAWAAARRESTLPANAVYELRVQQVLNGHHADAAQVLGESTLPLLQSLGAHVVGVFDLLLGAPRPSVATFLAWTDLRTQQQAWARLHVEPRFWRRRDDERSRFRRRLVGDESSMLLHAVPGCEPAPNFGVAP
jgi:hypothetical protein